MVVNLLGGSEGTLGTPGQIVDVLPEELTGLRTSIADVLANTGGLLAGGYQFEGPFAAGLGGNEQTLLDLIMQISQRNLPNVGTQFQQGQFEGPFAAGLSATENQILGNIAGEVGPGRTAFGNVAEQTLRQTAGGQFLDPSTNPFLRSTIQAAQRPTLEAFQQIASPNPCLCNSPKSNPG